MLHVSCDKECLLVPHSMCVITLDEEGESDAVQYGRTPLRVQTLRAGPEKGGEPTAFLVTVQTFQAALPCRSTRPGNALVHLPSSKITWPLVMIQR